VYEDFGERGLEGYGGFGVCKVIEECEKRRSWPKRRRVAM